MKDYTIYYGRNVVHEMLKSKHSSIVKVIISSSAGGERIDTIRTLARIYEVEVENMDSEQFNSLYSKKKTQGVVVHADRFKYFTLEDVFEDARINKTFPLLLLLDRIQDPRNLGAIIRSASAFNVDAVVIPKYKSCDITPTVARASSGTVVFTKIVRVTNLNNSIKKLKNDNFLILGLDCNGDLDISEIDILNQNIAILVGAEGTGLKPILKKTCDHIIRISTSREVESLNVSCATSIVLYKFWELRTKNKS